MKKITTLLFGLACFLTLGAWAEEPTYVAQIGETDASYFTTIDEAIAAWDAGETLKLLADVTYAGTSTITFGTGTYTLDTNGKTFDWTARYSAGFTIPSSSHVKVVGGGTIAFNSSSSAKDVYLTGGKFTLDGAEMVVGKSSSYGIYVNTNGSSIELKDATVTINSTNTSTLYGIYCSSKTFSGSIDNTAIVATEAVKSSKMYAVCYRPFNKTDTLTISRGKIDLSAVPEAKTTIGIYVTKGNLDIDTSVKANGNVYSIAVDESSYSHTSEYVTITGGTYIGAINSPNKVLKISGGSFSVKPAAENMVEGYIVAKNEETGLYDVTEGEYVVSANGVPYASVEEMNANLPDLALVKVLKSNTAVTIPQGKTVTLANAADIVIGDVVNNGTLEITDATVLAGNVTNNGTIKVINAKTDGTGIGKFSEAAKGVFEDCLGEESFFVPEENGYYTIKRYVADVDGVKFTSAKDAFEAASNSQNALIAILCDIDLGTVASNSDTLKLTGCVARQVTQEDKNTYKLNFTGNTLFYKGETVNATLDLNGKTISSVVSTGTSQIVRIECGAKLTIKDSSETGTGKIVATSENDYVGGAAVATHGGSLVIESGTIVGNASGGNDEAVALNNASAYPHPELREGVSSTEVMYGSFKMTGGTIISASNGITFNVPGGEYEISGGTITTTGSGNFGAVWVLGSASVTISNATINAPNACGINVGRGGTPKAVVQDGTIVNAKYVFAMDDFIGSGCYGTLLVEGGKFDVATGGTLFNNSTAANKDTPNIIELSGGYYSVNPAESYRDYIAVGRVSSESGTQWVLERLPVAQIGETKYETLQAAVDAAQNGAVITLLENFSLEEAITVRGKAVEIRTADYNTAKTPTIGLRVNYMDKNKITAQTIIYFRKPVTNTSTPTEVDRLIVGDFEAGIDVLTAVNTAEAVRWNIGLHDNVTLTKDIVIPDDYGHYLTGGINVKVSCTFDLNGHTLTQTSGAKGGWSNLMLFDATCDWTIPGVETMTFTLKDSKKTGAIYVPLHAVNATGKTVVNIEDVNIVYGHNCTAGDVTQDNKSGGQAIIVVTANNGGTVNLKGDTRIVRDEDCILTGKYPWTLLPYEGTTMNVESGYYEGLIYGNGNGYGALNITGGTFESDYVKWFYADDRSLAIDPETGAYLVVEAEAVAKIVDGGDEFRYASLQDAMDDAVDGDTVILLKDIDVTNNTGIVVNGSTDATLDLNGHEIHGYAHANKTSYVIYNLGVLTIKDSSEEKTGKIIAEATDPDKQAVPGYASNAITNYGHLTVDGIYIYAAGEGNACYAIDNDAENAQWRSTCDKDASTKIVYLKIVNGAKLRTASSSTVRQYLDSDEIWWNVVEMDGADMGSFWLQDNYQSSTKKGYYARGILSIKNSSFIYSVNLGYYNVAGYVNVTLENSTFTSFNNNLAQYFNVYPGDVSVSDCRVQYNFTMKQPKKCLTDGIYGNAPADTLIVEGYEVQDNKDAATKEKYPFTIGLIAKVPESIITELFDAETAEKYAEGDLEAKRKVEEKLETTEANGNKAWENYVMGIKSDDILHAHAEQEHDDRIEVKLAVEAEPPANSGFTVSYAMEYTDTAANTTTLNTLDIDLDDETVDPTGIYQVKAILTPDNGGEAVVIDTQNKVGVVKATQPTEIAVIAVPWKQFMDGDHISVSNLVKTANLTPGDKLYIYEGEKYDVWALDGNRHWQQATSVSSENGEQIVKAPFGAAHEHPVGHGTGVFLERQNSSVPYYLYGEVDEGASLVTTVEEERMPIANPNLKPFDLNGYYYDADTKGWKYSIEANEGDVITIPMGKTQRKCIFKDGGWGYYQKKVENGVLKQTWVNEVKIPAGTGCWYIKNGENNVKIDWASQK